MDDRRNHGGERRLLFCLTAPTGAQIRSVRSEIEMPRPSLRIQPAVGVGKCAGRMSVDVSAYWSRKRHLIDLASVSLTQKQLLSCGSAHCRAVCIRSPLSTAAESFDRTITLTCPGVWPGVGTSCTQSSTTWLMETNSICSQSTIGRTLSSK